VSEADGWSMSRYLAEMYLAHIGELEAMTSPLRAAERVTRLEGTRVRAGLQATRVVAAMEATIPGQRDARQRKEGRS
jgi:hypothetical protein